MSRSAMELELGEISRRRTNGCFFLSSSHGLSNPNPHKPKPHPSLSSHSHLSLHPPHPPSKPPTLTLSLLRPKSILSAASSSPPLPIPAQNPTHSPLTGSTRTITTIFSLALALSLSLSKLLTLKLGGVLGLFSNPITPPTATGPLFFAAINEGAGPWSAGAPIAVIAAGLARWLKIYSCVLLIRVLLSWFPNIPWEKQPFSAVRDLCDPYLSLFRGIILPLFNSLDVSPILAFLLLGMLGQFARAPWDATLAYKAEALELQRQLRQIAESG
ncbi:hypothetical protein RHSIM_Rhsim09G0097000 [Rhododendron simsii]|uniref:YGGT family protein n=1 Tax=Rhododendron simsii TaxID=118357 RepID=A0A834LF48_RHOSS|nr:hypothetical protein RHSIM_Rhsim09G0097000 [Rhododendron simsii]